MADLIAGADPDLRRRWETLRLGYTESQGLPELREEIAELYRGSDPGRGPGSRPGRGRLSLHERAPRAGRSRDLYLPRLSIPVRARALDRLRGDVLGSGGGRRLAVSTLDRLDGMPAPGHQVGGLQLPPQPHGGASDKGGFRRDADRRGIGGGLGPFRRDVPPARVGGGDPSARGGRGIREGRLSLRDVEGFGLAGLRIGWVVTHDQGAPRADGPRSRTTPPSAAARPASCWR